MTFLSRFRASVRRIGAIVRYARSVMREPLPSSVYAEKKRALHEQLRREVAHSEWQNTVHRMCVLAVSEALFPVETEEPRKAA